MSNIRPSITIYDALIQKFVASDYDSVEEIATALEGLITGASGTDLPVDFSAIGYADETLGELLTTILTEIAASTTAVAGIDDLNEALATNANALASLLTDGLFLATTDVSGFASVLDEDDMASNSAIKLATQQSIRQFVENSIVAATGYQGGYNATTNVPDIDFGDSAAAAGILKGYNYDVTTAGTFFATPVAIGDTLKAIQDNPTTISHWVHIPNTTSDASIKVQYENNADTNPLTDAFNTILGYLSVTGAVDLDDIKTNSDASKVITDFLTATGAINLDAIKVKADYLTVTGAVDLDAVKTNSDASKVITDFITLTGAFDLDTAKTEIAANKVITDFLTVTGAIDLDANKTATDASKIITDYLTVTGALDLDAMALALLAITMDNTVIVNELADFPTPAANVITLVADTTYIITANIAMGLNRLVLANNVFLKGSNPKYSTLTYTGTGVFITAGSGITHSIFDLNISASTGTWLALTGGGTETAYYSGVTVTASLNNAAVANWYAFFWQKGAIVSAGAGMTWSGACNTLILELVEFVIWDNSTSVIDLGAATFNVCSFVRCGFQGLTGTGQYGIDFAVSSANINSGYEGRVHDCTFGATLTAGILNSASGDVRWNYRGNNDAVEDSRVIADFYMTGNVTGTSASGTPAAVAGTWTQYHAEQFTVSATGLATYTGVHDTHVNLHASLFADASSGSLQKYFFGFALNGSLVASTVSSKEYTTGAPGSLAAFGNIKIVNGDTLQLFVEKDTGSDTITVEDVHVVISES